MRRFPVLDIWTDAVTLEEALEQAVTFVEQGNRPHTILATNPEKNFSVPQNPLLYDCFKNADVLLPDGIGMVLGARFLHGAHLSRVPGCEFMQELCAVSEKRGYRIFIYGGREEVSRKAVDVLRKRLPNIQIVGRCNGYLPPEKMDDLVDQINATRAEILFLALGSPNQEKWFVTYGARLEHVRVCQGIGGTLDVISGNVKRAPKFFCNLGLEWFYRLCAEPGRWRRQLVLPVFVWRLLVAKMHSKKNCK